MNTLMGTRARAAVVHEAVPAPAPRIEWIPADGWETYVAPQVAVVVAFNLLAGTIAAFVLPMVAAIPAFWRVPVALGLMVPGLTVAMVLAAYRFPPPVRVGLSVDGIFFAPTSQLVRFYPWHDVRVEGTRVITGASPTGARATARYWLSQFQGERVQLFLERSPRATA